MNNRPHARILIVDDQKEMAQLIAEQLCDVGYEVDTATHGVDAVELAGKHLPDAVIADLRMDGMDGFDVLDAMLKLDPMMPVLIMTAFGSIDTAVDAIKRGAYHYITKPFKLSQLLLFVERAVSDRRLKEENRFLKRRVEERAGLNRIVGKSRSMNALYTRIERAATSDVSILIRGESGTGKELVAESIHQLSERKAKPFVALNCTAIPEQLLESELFGHVKGAFTGAVSARKGILAEADGGTLFLDEIGDMPTALQAKLLRFLEDSTARAVGSDTVRKVDVRVIAATHQNLEQRIQEGVFRADLFYRLNVLPMMVPPLRERIDDIPVLIDCFVEKLLSEKGGLNAKRISPKAVEALARLPWPGNVRELKNAVQRLLLLCEGDEVTDDDVRVHLLSFSEGAPPVRFMSTELVPLKTVEESYIQHVIAQCNGNKSQAARILGIDVSTIYRTLKENK